MTNSFPKRLILACTVAALVYPMAATAQDGQPAGPPLDKMAAQLGVSEALMASCMPRRAKGARAERPDPSAITACLKKGNARVTQQSVTQTLEAFKPEQRSRGN